MKNRTFSPFAPACLLLLAGNAALTASAAHAGSPGKKTTTGTTTATGTATATGTTAPGNGGCPPSGPGGPHGKLVAGTITSINATAGTITIASTSGTASTVTLTTSTVLTGRESISASAIALGDTLEVSGVPLSLQVSSIADDHTSVSSSTSTATSGSTSSASSAGTAPATGLLRIRGVVSALTPPTLIVDNAYSLTLSLSSSTTLSEIVSITASQIAVGDAAVAQVTSSSGTLTATRLDVTVPSS